MSTQVINDERYRINRKVLNSGELKLVGRIREVKTEVDAFVALASVCKIPVEVVHLHSEGLASLPVSVYGKTTVNYIGGVPYAALEPDQYGNLQLKVPPKSAVEVIFNREIPEAHGRNRGAHGRKIIYVVD